MAQENATHRKKTKSKRCLKITKLVLAAFPSIVFGAFTIVFSVQQEHVATQNRQQDQRQADALNIRSTFENYIDQISTLLLDPMFTRNSTEYLLHVRVKTLNVLRHVNPSMKRAIIFYLYEYGLLRSNIPENERLNLFGADLHDVQFIGSALAPLQLDYLYLAGVYASNIVFNWCHLKYAVFDNASIANIKILNSTISYTSFRHAYASDAILGNLIFHANDITGAIFIQAQFIGVTGWERGLDLTNTDLFGSYDSHGVLLVSHDLLISSIIFKNTRLPDGSFALIDSSNLIVNGGAEQGCRANESQKVWLPRLDIPMILLHSRESDATHPQIKGNGSCYFLTPPSRISSLMQLIRVQSFSVLIDSGHAACNLSAYIGCVGKGSKSILVSVSYLLDTNVDIDRSQNMSTMETPKMMTLKSMSIPKQTRLLRVELTGDVENSSSAMCVIDDIQLSIVDSRK